MGRRCALGRALGSPRSCWLTRFRVRRLQLSIRSSGDVGCIVEPWKQDSLNLATIKSLREGLPQPSLGIPKVRARHHRISMP